MKKLEEGAAVDFKIIEDATYMVRYMFQVIPTQGPYQGRTLDIRVTFLDDISNPTRLLRPYRKQIQDGTLPSVAINKSSAEWIELLDQVCKENPELGHNSDHDFTSYDIEFSMSKDGYDRDYHMANLGDIGATITIMNTVQAVVADFLGNNEHKLMALKFTADINDKGRIHSYKRLAQLLSTHLDWVGMAGEDYVNRYWAFIVWDPEVLSSFAEV